MRHFELLPPWAAILIAILVMVGATMTLLGGVGIVRLKGYYQRLHAPTLGDTGVTGLIILSSMLMFSQL